MDSLFRFLRGFPIVIVCCITASQAGCNRAHFISNVQSSADSDTQVFDNALVGTWVTFEDNKPCFLVTLNRKDRSSADYTIRLHAADRQETPEEWSGVMRLLKIGDHQFAEVEESFTSDTPRNEEIKINGKVVSKAYILFRVLHDADTLQVWGFDGPNAIREIATNDSVSEVSWQGMTSIVDCPPEAFQKLLLKHGHKMSMKADDFTRLK